MRLRQAGKIVMVLSSLMLWATMAGAEKTPVLSSLAVELYGFVRLDVAYSTVAAAAPGYYILSVPSSDLADPELYLSANVTRFGFNLLGPEWVGGKVSGKLEMDLTGPGAADNKSVPFVRLAYMDLNWDSKFSLSFGQNSDLLAVQYPETVNFTPLWHAGALGYRRAMIRAGQGIVLGEKTKLDIKLALARTGDATGVSGTDSAIPTVQGSLVLSTPLFSEAPAMLAVSGHWGRDEVPTPTHDQVINYDSHSIKLDAALPLVDGLLLKACAWQGSNLAAYLGGIGQGINTALQESIQAKGGWVSLTLGPWSGVKFNLGASVDLPNDAQVASLGKQQNSALFANVFVPLLSNVKLGAEVSKWHTLYKDGPDGDALRLQSSMCYSF